MILTLPAPTLGAHVGTFGWAGVEPPFPRTEDWKIEEVLHSLAARPHAWRSSATISSSTVRPAVLAMKDHLPLDVSPCWSFGLDDAALSRFNVVIAKSDAAWVHPRAEGCFRGPGGREEYFALLRRLEDQSAGFVLTRSVPLPDGSSMLVFSSAGGRTKARGKAQKRPPQWALLSSRMRDEKMTDPSGLLTVTTPFRPAAIHRVRIGSRRRGVPDNTGGPARCLYHAWMIRDLGMATIDGTTYFLLDDDIMISMRYTRNLASGVGLVYNAGERVEGFTNPLLTFLAAGLHLLPATAPTLSLGLMLIDLGFSLSILFLLARFWGDTTSSMIAGLLSALLYMTLPNHSWHAHAGYEVYMLMAVLCLSSGDSNICESSTLLCWDCCH